MPLRLLILEDETDSEGTNQKAGDLTSFLARLTKDERFTFEERAAILEYDGGLTREEAELQARQLVAEKYGTKMQRREC